MLLNKTLWHISYQNWSKMRHISYQNWSKIRQISYQNWSKIRHISQQKLNQIKAHFLNESECQKFFFNENAY